MKETPAPNHKRQGDLIATRAWTWIGESKFDHSLLLVLLCVHIKAGIINHKEAGG